MTQTENKRLVCIVGDPAAGKSASLRTLRNPKKKVYLNCEAGKDLPFPNEFYKINITDPNLILDIFDLMNPPDPTIPDSGAQNENFDTIIIDTISFMMEMYESVHVIGSSNTQAAWGDYNQFFKTLMQQKVAKSDKAVIMLGHVQTEYNEKTLTHERSIPVKGNLRKLGLEAFFSIVVAAKRMEMKKLEPYLELQKALPPEKQLLHPTEEELDLGVKHVFQTKITKDTTGDRIRSPMGLFNKAQTFMDNDAQLLLDHLTSFYHLS